MPAKIEQIRVAILDDYQNVALSMADWSALDGRAAAADAVKVPTDELFLRADIVSIHLVLSGDMRASAILILTNSRF
jgi:hypothetical protein